MYCGDSCCQWVLVEEVLESERERGPGGRTGGIQFLSRLSSPGLILRRTLILHVCRWYLDTAGMSWQNCLSKSIQN